MLFRAKPDPRLALWDKLMRTVEVPFAAEVEAEKNRYIEEASQSFPITLRLSDSAYEIHEANMLAIARKYDGIAIRVALHEALKGVKSLVPIMQKAEAWEQLWLYLVGRWVAEFGAARARETARTTREDMQKIIDKALSASEEFNPVQVAAQLLKVQALSAYRATTIARTEVHAAMMFASEEGTAKVARDNQLTVQKAWLPVQDERTRVSHSAMSSHPAIEMDADFTVGGVKMKRPGDPRGGAANCINCRCVLIYKEAE